MNFYSCTIYGESCGTGRDHQKELNFMTISHDSQPSYRIKTENTTFRYVTQWYHATHTFGGALRDIPKNDCEGDYV